MNLNLTDKAARHRAFRTPLIKVITIEADRFGSEPESTAKNAQTRSVFMKSASRMKAAPMEREENRLARHLPRLFVLLKI